MSSYTADDAGNAALLAAISKSPRDYAPVPGNRRPIGRRNQILALMARNGYIPESLAKRCQGEPIRVAPLSPIKTDAPAAIEHVLDELTQHGGSRFGVEDLFQGRIVVRSTIDARVQTIVNEALEHGLALYEKRHPKAKGLIQGSVVVLGNADAAILAEAGGRQVYRDRDTRYSDYNRVTGSLRQPGSAMKPLVYLAAFESGLDLDTTVPDEPIEVPLGGDGGVKWIANYDNQFKGPIPMRQALAESRNAVAVWITREIGVDTVIRTAHQMGIRTPLQPYLSTALGASEVRLLELADAYRAIASGVLAEPHVIDRVTDVSGDGLYEAPRAAREIRSAALRAIQEGLRGVVRLPDGTAHSLDAPRLSDPGDGQDRDDERLPRCAVRGVHLRDAGDHRGGPDRLRRQPSPGGEGDRRAHGAADLPRDHAPRLQGPARRAGAALPPRDRGRDRQVPGDAGGAGREPRRAPGPRRTAPGNTVQRGCDRSDHGSAGHPTVLTPGWRSRVWLSPAVVSVSKTEHSPPRPVRYIASKNRLLSGGRERWRPACCSRGRTGDGRQAEDKGDGGGQTYQWGTVQEVGTVTHRITAQRKRIEQAAYAVGHSDGVRLGYSIGKAEGLAEGYESARSDLTQQTLWRVESLKQMVPRPPDA